MNGGVRRIGAAAALWLLIGSGCGNPSTSESISGGVGLEKEYTRLRADNAVLRARLSLSRLNDPYVYVDIPGREVRLELGGVILERVPVQKIEMNRAAKTISRDTTRIAFCSTPFVLESDAWYEDVPTLALKDSSAVMDRPDTTGMLAERVRAARVLGMLRFERDLRIVLEGVGRSRSPIDLLKGAFRFLRNSARPGSGDWTLRKMRRRGEVIELRITPAHVRTLAPNLRPGTKLVLLF